MTTKKILIVSAFTILLLMATTNSAEALIKKFEGKKLKAYQDSAGIWTIGYGSTINLDTKKPIKKGDVIDDATALRWLNDEIRQKKDALIRLIKVPVNGNQMSAMVSLAYNIGTGAFGRSTLLKKLNAGLKKENVAPEFLRWNKVRKDGILVEEKGLTNRRKLEMDLFLS